MKAARDASLTGIALPPQRLTMPSIADEVASDVKRAGLPDYDETSEESAVERLTNSVELASPLPLDENGEADSRVIEELVRHDQRVAEADARVSRCRARQLDCEEALVRAPRCWSRARTFASVSAFVVLALLVAAVVGLVLTSTLDQNFFGNYVENKSEDDAGLLAMIVSFVAAGGFVLVVCLLQLTVVVATSGEVGKLKATALVFLDLVFALAWGMQRVTSDGGYMAVSVTLLEFVTIAAYSVALGGLIAALNRNGPLARAFRDAHANARAANRACVRAESARRDADAEMRHLRDRVAVREFAGRTRDVRRSFVAETARAAFRTATGNLIHAVIVDPTLDRLNADLDRHLAARGATIGDPPKSKVQS